MTFSAGAVLTAAQLNDISITSIDVADGTVSLPSIANTGDLDTGIYFPNADSLAVTAAGEQRYVAGVTSTILLGPTASEISYVYLRSPHTAAHTGDEGDVALVFGDGDDANQAGLYWDLSATDLIVKSYNNTTALTFNASDQVEFNAGTVSLPPITYTSDTDTGIFFPAVAEMAVTIAGSTRFHWTNSIVSKTEPMRGEDGSVSAPTYGFTTETNTGIFLASTGDMRLCIAGSSIARIRAGDIIPNTNGTIELGLTTARWQELWTVDITSTNAVTVDSDMRLKTRTGDALGLPFLRGVDTFSGRWTAGDDDRVHQWCSAQNIAEQLDDAGINPADTSMWREDDNGSQRLAYGELIPVLIAAVKELDSRLDEAGL